MSTSATSPGACPIASTLEAIGEKWSLLILRDIFRGLHKFSEIHQSLGCPKNLLSTRLKTLEAAGILRREEYREAGTRPRAAYHLTPAGTDLLPVLAALQTWGLKHREGTTVPLRAVHTDCGGQVASQLTCTEGHALTPAEVEL